MIPLVVAIGGAFGALARYLAGVLFPHDVNGFPWRTLLINLTGSFLLGFVYRYVDGMASAEEVHALVGIGFCGAFTTFSTFSLEAVTLMQSGHAWRAAAYAVASVVLCLIGTAAGLYLGGGRV
jgi:CrcB protein